MQIPVVEEIATRVPRNCKFGILLIQYGDDYVSRQYLCFKNACHVIFNRCSTMITDFSLEYF